MTGGALAGGTPHSRV